MKKLIQIIFACTLMFIATTALAAKQEKVLICHVGNEMGPNGEVYLDDPGCIPHEDNNYFCPDAGKIDLISIAKVSKHLGNPSHEYDGISDYLPADVGASGEGSEDSNGDGIDDGCEPPETCPCWTASQMTELTPPNLAGANTNFDAACEATFPTLIENFQSSDTGDGYQLAVWAEFAQCFVYKAGSWEGIALPSGFVDGLTDVEVASCQALVIGHAQSYAEPGVWDCWSP